MPGRELATRQPTHWTYTIARLWVRGLLTLAGVMFAGVISFLLGFNPVPQAIPLVVLVQQYPIPAIVAGCLLFLVSLSALRLSHVPGTVNGSQPSGSHDDDGHSDVDLSIGWQAPRILIATAISTSSTTLFLVLLGVVLLRPAWCPTVLCSRPQAIAVTNPHAAHDSNLETYYTALQSDNFVIPGNPAGYTLDTASQSIGAIRSDAKTPQIYRVVFGVHSLQQGRFGILVTQVALVVVQVPPTPQPLNVWERGGALNYNSDPFVAHYAGQLPGALIPAVYEPVPGNRLQLAPGEADQVDLQVASGVPVDMRFKVQVAYRVTNEATEHTLVLPETFEVVFSDSSNWHPYELNGHFVPVSNA